MRFFVILLLMVGVMTPIQAQDLSAIGQVLPRGSVVKDGRSETLQLTLNLTQRVPYRIFTLTEPNRLVLEFNVLGFEGLDTLKFDRSEKVDAVHFGALKADQSRLVLELSQPMAVTLASITGGAESASLQLAMSPVSQEEFDQKAELQEQDVALSEQIAAPKARPTGDRPWVIALDPGHGGIDPGADGGRRSEADLMLLFGFELRDALRRSGEFDVVMTREEDVFVGLEDRMTIAREAGADVFISLHADAVVEGYAEGLTTYVLSDVASSEADAKLAARHNRSDILAGVDLSGRGDDVANVLLDMVRRETRPRTERLAAILVENVKQRGGVINSKSLRMGDFAVLRSADIPSVLIELGFLSSDSDLQRLNDPVARKVLIDGIVGGLKKWSIADAAEAELLRK